MAITVSTAGDADAGELAEVAAATFPLACPPSADAGDIAACIAANLSPQCFAGYLNDPRRRVLVARDAGRIIGYAMLIRGQSDQDPMELSKMYVLPQYHRSGAAGSLMSAGLQWAAQCAAPSVWLGVNRDNERAQRFYRRHGFEVTGTRTFQLGAAVEHDFVMSRPVSS